MPLIDIFRNMDSLQSNNIPTSTFSLPSKAKGPYAKKLAEMKNIVIDKYKKGIGLNESIAQLATERQLNQEQIKRLLEEANQEVYLIEYAKLKHKVVRDVKFEIASLSKIKDLMNPEDSKKIEQEGGNAMQRKPFGVREDKPQGIAKRAFEEDAPSVKFDCFNYTAYETGSMMPDAYKDVDPTKFAKEKIAKELDEIDVKIEKLASDVCDTYNELASNFIEIGRHNNNTVMRNAYIQMCKEASFDLGKQKALNDIFDERLQMAKKAGYVNPNDDLSLDLIVDYSKPNERFDLGKYSLSKIAEEDTVVINPNKTTMKKINDLVKLADKVQKQQGCLKTEQEKKKKITKSICSK